MKISIFETEHFEGAFPVIKLFDMPGNEITVLTTPDTHKRFLDLFGKQAKKFTWALLNNKSKFSFFYSLYKNLRKHKPDVLYLNTISDNHLLYAFVLRMLGLKRIVMTVHDINCLFESESSWRFRPGIIHRGKRALIKKVNEFNVVADTMIPYLQTKTGGKKTHNVPGAVFEGHHSFQMLNGPIRIVVPGSLDKRRRDYEQVFALAALSEKENVPLQITLLGGMSDKFGQTVVDRADQSKNMIAYHTYIVDQDEFDKQMDAAHFVFIPSVIDTKICGDIPETYGITKSSGNLFDVIKHAKPFIIPTGLTVSENLTSSCFKYNNTAEILNFLTKTISTPGLYTQLQNKAVENSANYTIENIRERNTDLFKS